MVRLSQNGSIISEIWPENILEIGHILSMFSHRSLPRKFPRKSHEIGHFLRKFVPENLAKFDLFLHDLSEALLEQWPLIKTIKILQA